MNEKYPGQKAAQQAAAEEYELLAGADKPKKTEIDAHKDIAARATNRIYTWLLQNSSGHTRDPNSRTFLLEELEAHMRSIGIEPEFIDE